MELTSTHILASLCGPENDASLVRDCGVWRAHVVAASASSSGFFSLQSIPNVFLSNGPAATIVRFEVEILMTTNQVVAPTSSRIVVTYRTEQGLVLEQWDLVSQYDSTEAIPLVSPRAQLAV